MPDTLTIYKASFGEDGFLLSFIEPLFGAKEEEEYIKMSSFNGLYGKYVRAFDNKEELMQANSRVKGDESGPTT
jgi:hypothetical protein